MKIQKISAQKILVKCLKLKSSDLCGLFGGALGAYQIKMQKCKSWIPFLQTVFFHYVNKLTVFVKETVNLFTR